MFVEELRKALQDSKEPAKDIAARAGVHPVNLSQFKSGVRATLSPTHLTRLAKAIGLEIAVISQRKKK